MTNNEKKNLNYGNEKTAVYNTNVYIMVNIMLFMEP